MGAPSGQGRPKVSEGRLGRVSQRRVVHKLSFGKEQAGHFLMAAKGGKENKGIRGARPLCGAYPFVGYCGFISQ